MRNSVGISGLQAGEDVKAANRFPRDVELMVNQKHFEMLPQFRTLHVSVKEGERKSAAASTQPEITASHSSTLPRGASRKAPSPANAERRVTCNVPNGTNVAVRVYIPGSVDFLPKFITRAGSP